MASKKKAAPKKQAAAPLKIIVFQRGWVVVGRINYEGDRIRVTDCSVIRRWGTTAGLGQLATEGPRPQTVLDRCPDVRAHALTVVLEMDCVEAAWAPR